MFVDFKRHDRWEVVIRVLRWQSRADWLLMGGLKNEALAGRLCHEGEWAWKIREILLPGSQTMNTTKTVLAVCAMAGAVLGTGRLRRVWTMGAKPAGRSAGDTPATPETRPDVKPDEKPVSPYVLDHKAKSIDGKEVDLETYKGKVVLIVNVASKCGFTPQYKGLEALYESKKDAGLVILGFPSNDFKQQEPGSEADIKKFCTENYGVTFPMFSKIVVKGRRRTRCTRIWRRSRRRWGRARVELHEVSRGSERERGGEVRQPHQAG